uniref:tRNA-2-methylthio-N(6)-dimethylallyladenosine synthase n=1 Tax=uncultured bacterium CSLF42 TaxID=1091574 RepID=G4WVZ6_9BACT|nr:(dimethylallyl)adenosine tRNA methylthiotransferase [uncultured bacterium CSLF42]
MKYFVYSYGCQMNTADSEEMAQPLMERGFLSTGRLQEADIVLMNTCTVRDQAEHRADSNIGRLRIWKEKDPNRILIVAGCAASRWGESIKKKYPFIDLVSPATRIEQFPEAVAQVLKERWNWHAEMPTSFTQGRKNEGAEPPEILTSPRRRPADPSVSGSWFGDENTAYVTIMRGCNYACSYCIVPQVRGRELYRPMLQILDEIRQKAAEGHKDVMLLGQTVNSYFYRSGGSEDQRIGARSSVVPPNLRPADPVVDFSDLLRAVNALDDIESIRFMSPHPRHMRPNVIQTMAECDKVARHIHLPVQSGSDRMLASMKRLYTRQEYLEIVKRLRTAIPNLEITTDIIVGYPGETEDDFQQTLSLLDDVRFDALFAFKYSPRPGTASAAVEDDVTEDVKEARHQRVLAWLS